MRELEPKEDVWRPSEKGEQISGIVIDMVEEDGKKQLLIEIRPGVTRKTPIHQEILKRIDEVRTGWWIMLEYRGSVETRKGKDLNLYKAWCDERGQKPEERPE